MNNLFYDGFNSKLIETAIFDTVLEIPVLAPTSITVLPEIAVPFSKRHRLMDPTKEMLVFYEHDPIFRKFVSVPQKYVSELQDVKMMSTPDCSVYRDMPLWEQITNIAVARSIGYYLQQNGKQIIPNVRWGDERTYTSKVFGFAPAFVGIEKHQCVCIGSYGCCKKAEDKYYLESGLAEMLAVLEPSTVIVYGAHNPAIFGKYERYTHFHYLQDWTSRVRSQAV